MSGFAGSGYREVVDFLQGRCSLEETAEEIRRAHRRYARRQVTWCRHQLPGNIMVLNGDGTQEEVVDQIMTEWESAVGKGIA